MEKIRVLLIKFRNELPQTGISAFRGAVNALLQSNNVLFHNHTDEGLRYAYPLIQYKRINRRAALVCIEEGTEAVGEFFGHIQQRVVLGRKETLLEIDTMKAEQTLVQVWNSEFSYSLRKWLPFNSDNYALYQQTEGLKKRLEQMEKILTGNILSFAKGVGVHFEQEVSCTITDVQPLSPMRYKDVKLAAFDVRFKSNVSLPNFIGLGKGASHGFGTVVRMSD
ncbi:MAG: hypothetical protein LBM07_01430 [Culturomica sp.]|jgi:hypothetical protein|nr:hypothetical protein [Culturomica sp.]